MRPTGLAVLTALFIAVLAASAAAVPGNRSDFVAGMAHFTIGRCAR